jgi:hypothetical protein
VKKDIVAACRLTGSLTGHTCKPMSDSEDPMSGRHESNTRQKSFQVASSASYRC